MHLQLDTEKFNRNKAHLIIAVAAGGRNNIVRMNVNYDPKQKLTAAVEKQFHKLAEPFGTYVGFELKRANPKIRKPKELPVWWSHNDVEFGWYRELDCFTPLLVEYEVD